MTAPQFPPLFRGEELSGKTNPIDRAKQLAIAGTEPGMVVYNISRRQLLAAVIFAPEVSLEEALFVLPACGIGFQNALGALAPPEVAVHLEWPGAIRVNGALCGKLSATASTSNPAEEPDWLVVGIEIKLTCDEQAPGKQPDRTVLMEEGCADVEPIELLESWVRHTLYWINRWNDEGLKPLHSEWRGLAHDLGEEVDWGFANGLFVGLDASFGALLRKGVDTEVIQLSRLLETDR